MAVGLAAVCASCGEAIVVRQTTRVFRDASIDRKVEIRGWTSDGDRPTDRGWMEHSAGLRLADREAWDRIDESPGYLFAEKFFLSADEIPVTLGHHTDAGWVDDEVSVNVVHEDLVVLHRWTYAERIGDPFGKDDLARALGGLFDVAAEILREEIAREFGETVDATPAEAFVEGEAREVARDALQVLAANPGEDRDDEIALGLMSILEKRGIPVANTAAPPDMDEDAHLAVFGESVLSWSRSRVAAAISTPESIVEPEELPFWPELADVMSLWDDPDEEPADERAAAMRRHAKAIGQAIYGYYGDVSSPSFRFEYALELPGRLMHTNGTSTDDGVFWLFRGSDLAGGEKLLHAESVELDLQALVALGARRDLDTEDLARLLDLLTARDPEGGLRDLLPKAVDKGKLSLLKDEAADEAYGLARELSEILDPSFRR